MAVEGVDMMQGIFLLVTETVAGCGGSRGGRGGLWLAAESAVAVCKFFSVKWLSGQDKPAARGQVDTDWR